MAIRSTVPPVLARRLALPLRDNAWYGIDIGPAGATNNPLAADTVYWFPIFLPRTTPVRRLAVMVGTSVPSSTMRLALYDARADQPAPRNYIAGSMTELDLSPAVNTVVDLDLGPSLVLPAGWYWAGARGNNAPQPRTVSTSPSANGEFSRLLGQASPVALFANFASGSICRISSSLSWSSPWPAVAPSVTYGSNAPGSVVVAWRRN